MKVTEHATSGTKLNPPWKVGNLVRAHITRQLGIVCEYDTRYFVLWIADGTCSTDHTSIDDLKKKLSATHKVYGPVLLTLENED